MKKLISCIISLAIVISLCVSAAANYSYCPYCGKSLSGGSFAYCPYCGSKLSTGSGSSGGGQTSISTSSVRAGDYITFGHYKQSGSIGNSKEAIEWLVLDVWDGQALVISRYGLDAKPYNTAYTGVTWESCSLRKWLNSSFLNAAFTSAEQSAILTTTVDNSAGQGYSGYKTDGGRNTQDKVFLLSYAEANQYLNVTHDSRSNNMEARTSPTASAKAAGAGTNSNKTAEGTLAGWWWLRSPGEVQYAAAYISTGGYAVSIDVGISSGMVRPAMVIDLNSGLF